MFRKQIPGRSNRSYDSKFRNVPIAEFTTIYRTDNDEITLRLGGLLPLEPWGNKYPAVALIWKGQLEQVVSFRAYSAKARIAIYPMNAIESSHLQLRNVCKYRGYSPRTELPESCAI